MVSYLHWCAKAQTMLIYELGYNVNSSIYMPVEQCISTYSNEIVAIRIVLHTGKFTDAVSHYPANLSDLKVIQSTVNITFSDKIQNCQ